MKGLFKISVYWLTFKDVLLSSRIFCESKFLNLLYISSFSSSTVLRWLRRLDLLLTVFKFISFSYVSIISWVLAPSLICSNLFFLHETMVSGASSLFFSLAISWVLVVSFLTLSFIWFAVSSLAISWVLAPSFISYLLDNLFNVFWSFFIITFL